MPLVQIIYDEVEAKIWTNKNANGGLPLGQEKLELKKYNKDPEKFRAKLSNRALYTTFRRTEISFKGLLIENGYELEEIKLNTKKGRYEDKYNVGRIVN